jgi:hypothetical protein
MMVARNLKFTHQVGGTVRDIDANFKALAEGVNHKVKMVEVVTRCVHDEMEAVKDGA